MYRAFDILRQVIIRARGLIGQARGRCAGNEGGDKNLGLLEKWFSLLRVVGFAEVLIE